MLLPGRLDAMKDVVVEAAECNNEFAVDLYSQLMEDDGNLFFSPYSISTALAMVYAGARGRTEAQMASTLHFDMSQEELHLTFAQIIDDLNSKSKMAGNELNVANALWAQKGYPFLDDYMKLVGESYRAEADELDFSTAPEESRVTINRWAEERTKEKIKDLIPEGIITELTTLVLTNAIYFKAAWEGQFKADRTKDEDFMLPGGETVKVPMMMQTARYGYAEEEDFQILEMPYSGRLLSMIVFLPKEKDGLKEFERGLAVIKLTGPTMREDIDKTPLATRISDWMGKIRSRHVAVSMPRFNTTSSFKLNEVLVSMGMKDAFSMAADFSGMTGNKELYISAVLHKAYVDVNEEGTEAAAATAAVMDREAVVKPVEPVVFKADHPFMFLIRDNSTESILFMGRVIDPTK